MHVAYAQPHTHHVLARDSVVAVAWERRQRCALVRPGRTTSPPRRLAGIHDTGWNVRQLRCIQ